MHQDPVIVVSGLPRSGTSLMMNMLEIGGLEPMTDRVRVADEDNPRGYFEFEPVKKLPRDSQWLGQAGGRVVKVISKLLIHLPGNYRYRIVFMRREMSEILASQEKMLQRRGHAPDLDSSAAMGMLFDLHLRETKDWLAEQDNIEVLDVSYNELVEDPRRSIAEVARFLGCPLDEAKMAGAVDHSLHRQRVR